MPLECSKCGWSQPEQERKCPKCGARITKEHFGLSAPAQAPPAAVVAPTPTSPAKQPPPARASRHKPNTGPVVAALIVAATGGVFIWQASTGQPRVSKVTVQRARVVKTTGAAPVAQGEACTFRVGPAKGEPYNCRVLVRCGSEVLYGALEGTGYADCTVDGGVGTDAHEAAPNDRDPDIHYDLATARATLKEPTWQVDFELLGESGSAR